MYTTVSTTNPALYENAMAAKRFLQNELTKIRLKQEDSVKLSSQEIHHRLDLIHEIERKGFRYLDERGERKLTNLINEIDNMTQSASETTTA